jgi:hypothetical protein
MSSSISLQGKLEAWRGRLQVQCSAVSSERSWGDDMVLMLVYVKALVALLRRSKR